MDGVDYGGAEVEFVGDYECVFGFECELDIQFATKSVHNLIRWFEEVYPVRLSRNLFQRTSSEDIPAVGVPITREFYA